MGRQWGAAAFVGRSSELSALRQAWLSAVAGRPYWTLVGGEAGIGKTRLVAEFAGEVSAEGARVLVGNCPPVAPGLVPFAPLAEIAAGYVLAAADADAETDDLDMRPHVAATGLRLAADWPTTEARRQALTRRMLALTADPQCWKAPGRQGRAYLRTAEAEASRLTGPGDAGLWRAAAEAWEQIPAPHRAAYARLRLAEALLGRPGQRQQAQAEIAAARETAVSPSAGALADELEHLAIRARLGPVPDAPDRQDRYGLTQRERDVLGLVCAGCTNRQIATQLFISPKTASLHVSHILAKLSVTTRGEAAALAHRLGLDDPAVSRR